MVIGPTALHRFPCFDQRIAFKMNGEGHQNRDDKGFFPHSENAGTDDGQTGEDLEAHLQVFERSKGFLEHLNASDGDAGGGQNRNQQAVIAQKFRHHHDDENGEGDATSDKSPLVGTQAIGLGHSKGRLNAKHTFSACSRASRSALSLLTTN